jgi:ubiquinone biosynthesis protein
MIAELRTLQDRVAPLSFEEVRTVIVEDLSAGPDELFAELSPIPLATASIAQVHRARLPDGGEVVVKVQRPGLRPQIEADLEIMGFLARALEVNFPEARMFSPAGMVAEFERAIFKELDFGIELQHLERFRQNFKDNDRVRFPEPLRSLSTTRVLTMEYIDGTKITDISAADFDLERVMDTAFEAVLQMIYVDGFFHGDLHPGNVLVRDDGTICFIDVGLCGRLGPRQQDLLIDLLIAVVQQNFENVARLFWRMSLRDKDSTGDYAAFEHDVIECAEGWFAGKTMAQIEFSRVLGDLVALSLRHRIRLPPDYTMTFKAVMTMEGVGKQLRPDLDLLTAARPYAARLIAQRYQPQRLFESGYTAVRDLIEAVGSAPEMTRTILEDFLAGRSMINVESRQLDELRAAYAQVQQRQTIGLLAAAMAVCGTLALDYGEARFIGLPFLSLLFYAIAAALGARWAVGGK